METKLNVKSGDSYTNEIATTINNQIDFMTMCSWGVTKRYSCYANEMPALWLNVNGFIHKGDVFIALNEGLDTYEVFVLDKDMHVIEHSDDIYFDMLTDILDGIIERKPEWSDEEYTKRVDEWLSQQPA